MSTRLAILGSTGSIGRQALEIARHLAGRLEVVGLAPGGYNVGLLRDQCAEFRPRYAHSPALTEAPEGCLLVPLEEMVQQTEVDLVLVATVGSAGLLPTLAAIRAGKEIALANKEVLVMAGEIVAREAAARGVLLRPVDSEHSAIWQCLRGEDWDDGTGERRAVARLILTASGGAFRDYSTEQLASVVPAEALRHPTWAMGPKVTVDSATLLNKGLKVIEARWLFGLPYDRIEVVMHRESTVHSLVELADGSVKAQLGVPDMRVPIQYALTYPDRVPSLARRLDLAALGCLDFASLDELRYPCFGLAIQAARAGGTYPAALSGADEAAVNLFLDGRIGYLDIPRLVESALSAHSAASQPELAQMIEASRVAGEHCASVVGCQ